MQFKLRLSADATDGSAAPGAGRYSRISYQEMEYLADKTIDFDLFFGILPGTKGPSDVADLNDFEVSRIDEGHE